ncbi:MAG TPA: c-type cytochrome [Rhodanobacteraceae bacterium]|nr:c-type cytochrome [Rhodanobacteraceae bacterium]
MKKFLLALGLLVSCTAMAATGQSSKHSVEHGKFLVGYGGCNDCHTPGWAVHGGHAPKAMLLTGGGMNFQGPWGTTYPPNLRLYFSKLTLKQWIQKARSMKARPAMPFWTFRYLSDKDLTDMYAYIRSLGPAGTAAHDWVPPGQTAPLPYFKMKLPPPPVRPAGH